MSPQPEADTWILFVLSKIGVTLIKTDEPMLLKNSLKIEKEFRSFLRFKCLKLNSLTLPQAFEAMEEFWASHTGFDVLAQAGDGIACYEDVTDHGRGGRLEIGLVRLLRVPPDDSEIPWPTHRLRLRLCYRWDMDVITKVLPAGTWSFACWDAAELNLFKQSVFDTPGFATMVGKKPAEVSVSFDTVSSLPHMLKPEPEARQMWWGVQ
ncbi:hypothetical protein G3257_17795 [Janthinobacterium lividum]|uniref:hypothetical protein n=1 Tax=Janthinobacterium lividum TaxID=29581 RepID=UPI0015951FBC|nr:hypothetical protein [Janthinobacterium lividum]QKY03924.1 hypothetical protein G3257_17795 [Janthinobacterium lividum]